jgi:hypothetical protein
VISANNWYKPKSIPIKKASLKFIREAFFGLELWEYTIKK